MDIAKERKLILNSIILGLLFCSCREQKYFFKSNQFNIIHPRARTNIGSTEVTYDTLINFKPKEGFWGSIKEKDTYLVIKTDRNIFVSSTKDSAICKLPDKAENEISFIESVSELKGKYFFPDILLDTFHRPRISFFDARPVLQGLTIPIRIRQQLRNPNLKDSFPSQVQTSVNVGIAFGWKFVLNYYKPSKNLFGNKGNQFSFTPGIFYGIGSSSLTKSNTRNPVIPFERNAFTHTFGGFGILGFNSINLGYAFGWDLTTGVGNRSWLYQGKFWNGIALSLDLIK
jgi:hypothetical protein